MPRTFLTHPRRTRIDLNGLWAFRACAAETPEAERATPPAPGACGDALPVPGVWESAVKYFRHRGLGWYVRTFSVDGERAGPARLVFEAVSHTATVWLDGQKLGRHYGAHTQFEFLLSLAPGEHVLAVLVDNRFGPANPLTRLDQDLYTWGGISRDVYLERLPEVHIASLAAVPRLGAGGWKVEVDVELARTEGARWPERVAVTVGEAWRGEVAVDKNGRGSGSIDVREPKLWAPGSPALYDVVAIAGRDVVRERIGFRTVEARGRQLLLNGKPLWLQGANRHEFHPDFGCALPMTVHLRDIEILQKLGANFVRGSHYPNDPFFLDLCDEHGIVFWEELAQWQATVEEMKSSAFREASLAQAEEMIRQHRHHPSILFWGMLNECHLYDPSTRDIVEILARRFRELDSTRLTSFATARPTENACLDLVDVVGLNLYPGWYHSDLEGTTRVGREYVDAMAQRAGERPLLLTEFGADGIGRAIEDRKGLENYQARVVDEVIAVGRADERVSGVCIWQFCDSRSSPERAFTRPAEYNVKGILTGYREPKLAFFAAQRAFRDPR